MEGLAPFLLFLFFMIINIYTGKKRQEQKRKQKQQIPDINNNPLPKANNRKNLDYMMAKPKTSPENLEATSLSQEQEVASKVEILKSYLDKYDQTEASFSITKNPEKSISNINVSKLQPDFIQQTEINTINKEKNIQIDIEREHIMNAIMYAQVLEQPKSLAYLKRFGIKRIIHKD